MGSSLNEDFKSNTASLNDGHPVTLSEITSALCTALPAYKNCCLLKDAMHQPPEMIRSFLEERITAAESGQPVNGDAVDLPQLFGNGTYNQWRLRAHTLAPYLKDAVYFWKTEVEGDVDDSHHYNWHYY